MHANARYRSPGEPRPGFSLIELLVALVLVDVGLLALTGTTLALVRQRTELRARDAAVRAASARLEWLGAGPCQPTSGSSAPRPLVVEHWHAQPGVNATRRLTDSVTFGPGGTRAFVIGTRLPC